MSAGFSNTKVKSLVFSRASNLEASLPEVLYSDREDVMLARSESTSEEAMVLIVI